MVSRLGFCCVIGCHLLSILLFATGNLLLAAILFLTGQVCFGLWFLYQLGGGLFLLDIRVVFIVSYALYGLTLPLLVLWANGPCYGLTPQSGGLVWSTYLFGAGLLGFNTIQVVLPTRWSRQVARTTTALSNLPALILMGSLLTWLVSQLAGVEPSNIDALRRVWLRSQAWTVANFVTLGVAAFLLERLRSSRGFSKILSWSLVLLYLGFLLVTGNRRFGLMLLILMAGLQIYGLGTRLSLRHLVLGAGLAVMLLVLGVVRVNAPISTLVYSNEFVYPMQTLVYYVDNPSPLLYGASYVSWPAFLIPRAWWPEKPVSLAIEFKLERFGTLSYQGYAYTPVTEAFRNFGVVGPPLAMAVVSGLLSLLVRYRRRLGIVYFVSLALVFEFNRGEFATTLYAFFAIWLGYSCALIAGKLFSEFWRNFPRGLPVSPAPGPPDCRIRLSDPF